MLGDSINFLFQGSRGLDFAFRHPLKLQNSLEVKQGEFVSDQDNSSDKTPFVLRQDSTPSTFLLYHPPATGFTRKLIFQFYTQQEKAERVDFWEKMSLRMRNIQLISFAMTPVPCLIGYVLSCRRLLSRTETLAIGIATLGIGILFLRTMSCESEAWDQMKKWRAVPLDEGGLREYYSQPPSL